MRYGQVHVSNVDLIQESVVFTACMESKCVSKIRPLRCVLFMKKKRLCVCSRKGVRPNYLREKCFGCSYDWNGFKDLDIIIGTRD